MANGSLAVAFSPASPEREQHQLDSASTTLATASVGECTSQSTAGDVCCCSWRPCPVGPRPDGGWWSHRRRLGRSCRRGSEDGSAPASPCRHGRPPRASTGFSEPTDPCKGKECNRTEFASQEATSGRSSGVVRSRNPLYPPKLWISESRAPTPQPSPHRKPHHNATMLPTGRRPRGQGGRVLRAGAAAPGAG
jgi:hypothetical protein